MLFLLYREAAKQTPVQTASNARISLHYSKYVTQLQAVLVHMHT